VSIWIIDIALQQEDLGVKQGTVVIKKYGNRRLYDTASSRYINLEDVAALIREGTDVQVVDAKTGENLTRVVLTQIITEDARGQPTGLPLELLRQLIIASDYARQEFLMWYLRTAFDTYGKVQDAFQSRLSEMGSAAIAPLQKMKSFLSSALAAEAPVPPAEVEELRRRVAELEARLGQDETKRRASKARKTRP
jgi:polyhydroxyalkanoate synthesis repressor PhaR